jgi:hypothetical protein
MPLIWSEIRQRAIAFARQWAHASRERAEAQTFWNDFFDVFGIRLRTVASFEEPVKNLKGDYQFIDLFWKGHLLAEHKSRGKDLSKAASQAFAYIQNLHNADRTDEIPRYIVVSDFHRIALHDLEAPEGSPPTLEFDLPDFHKHIRAFAFIAGYHTQRIDPEDPANFKAVEKLDNLHSRLEAVGYRGHDLQRFMVRILFCLFADDTGIFNQPDAFKNFILDHTRPDGADLGSQLSRLFDLLNTPEQRRQTNLDEDLAAFPYVNGDLFAERLAFPDFDRPMRQALVECCNFRWERISPAVFGSLFQGIMDGKARRQIGAHYTSERDILKLIRSLFLDDLRNQFNAAANNKRKLAALQKHLGSLRLLDPACGCGNFLVLAFRELRQLEMDVLQARFGDRPDEGDIRANCHLSVNQFFGIEIEEWPVRIAEVAMWLMDHQMNEELFRRFDTHRPTIPLQKSATIRQANALRIDWNSLLPAAECTHILGNPPFVGKQFMSAAQKADVASIWEGVKGAGVLDYVTCWYAKAGSYIHKTSIPVAFVSTNSITQGEQAGILWSELLRRGVVIHFGHRTFSWQSEARGRAHVHVVIVGWALCDSPNKRLYEYAHDSEEPHITTVRNISPYLIEAGNTAITSRTKPLCAVPEIIFGSMPNDGGHLLLTDEERNDLVTREPDAARFIRPILGSQEFINGITRWCLWLVDAQPAELRTLPLILQRVEAVKAHRLASSRKTTNKLAAMPTLFGEIRQPQTRYLAIPKTSSERRAYIPMAFQEPSTVTTTEIQMIPHATVYHFGVLSSVMHIAWVRQVCGRLKSDYRYSNGLVYNNYPWPQYPTDKQTKRVEQAAQAVLDARARFTGSTLAELYDPLTMPPALVKAHAALDTAVDRCYRAAPFADDRQRVEHLFALYEELTAPLMPATPKSPKPRRRKPPKPTA